MKTTFDYINEIAKLGVENEHLKKMLSKAKFAMKQAIGNENKENREEILAEMVKILETNKVKDLYELNFDL